MKIGFFGDSFCAYLYGIDGKPMPYKTYIEKLKDHYDAEITHLGQPGSSIWDTILLQFPDFIESPPDICIFAWTNPDRFFDRVVRKIKPTYIDGKYSNPNVWNAVDMYYKYLYDEEKVVAEAAAAVRYFDEAVLSKINSKIFHAWCFPVDWKFKNADYTYKFKHGFELDYPLGYFSHVSGSKGTNSPNHIGGDEYNQKLFEIIRDAVDAQRLIS